MQRLNENIEREAIVVRIITIVTLSYLPATFISTFFSTNIIHYDPDTAIAGGAISLMGLSQWLQITLPLTSLTLIVSWLGKSWAKRRSRVATLKDDVDEEAELQHDQQLSRCDQT